MKPNAAAMSSYDLRHRWKPVRSTVTGRIKWLVGLPTGWVEILRPAGQAG